MKRYLPSLLFSLVLAVVLYVQAQQFQAFSIAGFGAASNVSQCPKPAANFSALCPVSGKGWMGTINGSAYAPLNGAKQ